MLTTSGCNYERVKKYCLRQMLKNATKRECSRKMKGDKG